MTTDITELAMREKFEAWWEREYKHLESSKYTDAVPHIKYGFWMAYQAGGAELVEALEKAQTKAIAQGRTACELFDEVTALRQRIAELEESHAQVIQSRDHYKRISEEGLKQLAEPRTFIVKLPHQAGFDDPQTAYDAIEKCKAAIAAAGVTGIMWEVE
ncbi:hypothetical protein [Klebsiella aerogenes]|uniref:hypothetical protein n=1 Tax=Klebsiella aerogenes TaxID=548 RepID=UPI0021B3A0E5|nr:hypothetical protein [Klebsiella aerogenes]